jgi:hypothetical protein
LRSLKKLPAAALVLALMLFAGCRDGRIPCPDITGKKFTLFKKKAPVGTKEAPLGQNVDFGKNGLVKKKKNYKYLRNKPNRKKYK